MSGRRPRRPLPRGTSRGVSPGYALAGGTLSPERSQTARYEIARYELRLLALRIVEHLQVPAPSLPGREEIAEAERALDRMREAATVLGMDR